MSGKKSRLMALAAQREILLAESDLNRIHLIHEWTHLKQQTQRLTEPVKKFRMLASSAAKIGMMLSALRFFRRKKRGEKRHSIIPSLANLFRGTRTGFALWQMLRRAMF